MAENEQTQQADMLLETEMDRIMELFGKHEQNLSSHERDNCWWEQDTTDSLARSILTLMEGPALVINSDKPTQEQREKLMQTLNASIERSIALLNRRLHMKQLLDQHEPSAVELMMITRRMNKMYGDWITKFKSERVDFGSIARELEILQQQQRVQDDNVKHYVEMALRDALHLEELVQGVALYLALNKDT